jgi:hypothetical protein
MAKRYFLALQRIVCVKCKKKFKRQGRVWGEKSLVLPSEHITSRLIAGENPGWRMSVVSLNLDPLPVS